MACKLHVPYIYNPYRCEHRCACGAVVIRDCDERMEARLLRLALEKPDGVRDQMTQKATAGMRRSQSKVGGSVMFGEACRTYGVPVPASEYRFAAPRRWRFDFAWPDQKLALECQGGLFVNGRHSRGAALLKEHEKLNTAAQLGWRILFCTPQQMKSGEAVDIVRKAL